MKTIQLRLGMVMLVQWSLMALISLAIAAKECSDPDRTTMHEGFSSAALDGWRVRDGEWAVKNGRAMAIDKFALILHGRQERQDFEAAVDVAYSHNGAHASAGIVLRYSESDGTGYAIGLREVERGKHETLGPWERPVIQLYRWDKGGWKLLQESKVPGCRSGVLRRLKVICRGPNIWAYYEDMKTPVVAEYDPEYDRAGLLGLWKDQLGTGLYDNFSVGPVPAQLPRAPLRIDWSWVRGTVYVRSNAVNSVQMWHDYWDHTDLTDRELSYAALYGFNMVQVYLHWIVWERHKQDYVKRLDDFLDRADKHGLKVNLILWDDCGHVEPDLAFASPVPGRHNSQMMPNPSHQIRDSEAQLTSQKDRFKGYVEAVVGKFKDDKRIAFWQLYNECMGPKEKYRDGITDANLNRLLEWTREWVKGTGTKHPVTATGGAFYGPKYSDFYSYHSYRAGKQPLPNADGGPEHLCTETLDRPDADLADCVREFGAKQNGFVVWELMIGRDNCRFPWGHLDGLDEPAQPFHGVVYPDGHPWDVCEVKALLGDDRFAALKKKVFEVEYFNGEFKTSKKSSISPCIDIELGDESGYGSPDPSAGVDKDGFSIRWTGTLVAPAAGEYVFTASSDGVLRLWIGKTKLIDKADHKRREVQGLIELTKGERCPLKVEYVHRDGNASTHVYWSGPDFSTRILCPSGG
jgi:PA14 domain/Cellulase (glycosyl hydrolase family 5)